MSRALAIIMILLTILFSSCARTVDRGYYEDEVEKASGETLKGDDGEEQAGEDNKTDNVNPGKKENVNPPVDKGPNENIEAPGSMVEPQIGSRPGNQASGIKVDISGRVFDLNSLFSAKRLRDLSPDNLAILRNSIYAAKGYIFSKDEYTKFFSKYSWYDPKHKDVEGLLTKIDKQNLNLILKMEGKKAFYDVLDEEEKLLLGFWQVGAPGVGSGYNDTYTFNEDKTFEFRVSEMDGEDRIRALYGSWFILDSQLHLHIHSRQVLEGGKLEPAMGSMATEYEIVGGELVTEDYEFPAIQTYTLNFDQKALEFGNDCFGVLIDDEEFYNLGKMY